MMPAAAVPWWVGGVAFVAALFMAHWGAGLLDYRGRRAMGWVLILLAAMVAHSGLWLFGTGACWLCQFF